MEIRHGKPWLDAIFEDGIPTCDSVLVYFTPHSLASAVVRKELDAGVVSQLTDKSVALLPYVKNAALRAEVRSDIQALQVPEWNGENFDAVLAQCVAEVWRSFHERRIGQAIAEEKVRRMEAEKALKQSEEKARDSQPDYCGLGYSDLKQYLESRKMLKLLVRCRESFNSIGQGPESQILAILGQKARHTDAKETKALQEYMSLGIMELYVDGLGSAYCRLSPEGRQFINRLKVEESRDSKGG